MRRECLIAAALCAALSCGATPATRSECASSGPLTPRPTRPATASARPEERQVDAGDQTPDPEQEARDALAQMAKDMASAYDRSDQNGDILTPNPSPKLCPSATPVPVWLPETGIKYQSRPKEWSRDPGWSCLRFSLSDPQLFQYEVTVSAGKGFVARARRRDGKDLVELSLRGEIRNGSISIGPSFDEKRTRKEQP